MRVSREGLVRDERYGTREAVEYRGVRVARDGLVYPGVGGPELP